jgi:oligoribonuclease
MSDCMVWVDCEMTGLDLGHDALIEIAVLVTDADLNILGEGVDLVIKPDDAALVTMPDIVREMHTSSGLLDVLADGITMADAEAQVMEYVTQHVPDPRKAPLAGSSVHTDRTFLARDMPTFEGHVHYRNVDVSTLKELARRWFPRVYFNSPEKTGNHRALGDIKDSIDELRYYRATLLVQPPGPDSDAAKAAAAALR